MKAQFETVMARLKAALEAASYAEVGRAIGLTTSAYANRKRANSIPFEALVELASSRKISLDWLLLGEGEPGSAAADRSRLVPEIDSELIAQAVLELRRAMNGNAKQEDLMGIGRDTMLAALIYNKVVHLPASARLAGIRQEAQGYADVAAIFDPAKYAVKHPESKPSTPK